jgi:hypothetical protein
LKFESGGSSLVVLYDRGAYSIDGVHIGEHCIVVSLGIDHTGRNPRSAKNAAVRSSLVFALVINNSASPNQWRTRVECDRDAEFQEREGHPHAIQILVFPDFRPASSGLPDGSLPGDNHSPSLRAHNFLYTWVLGRQTNGYLAVATLLQREECVFRIKRDNICQPSASSCWPAGMTCRNVDEP